MTIQPSSPNRPRIEGPTPARTSTPVARVSDDTPSRTAEATLGGHRDVLDLSPAARALVARTEEDATLSAERMLELRTRVSDGTYNSPSVINELARRMRSSGDLR